MKALLFWACPYLLVLVFFLALRTYCRHIYSHVRNALEEKIQKLPSADGIPQQREDVRLYLSSFPECLLRYSLFTYPDPPLSVPEE